MTRMWTSKKKSFPQKTCKIKNKSNAWAHKRCFTDLTKSQLTNSYFYRENEAREWWRGTKGGLQKKKCFSRSPPPPCPSTIQRKWNHWGWWAHVTYVRALITCQRGILEWKCTLLFTRDHAKYIKDNVNNLSFFLITYHAPVKTTE